MQNRVASRTSRHQQGSTLVAVLLITFIVGIMAFGSIDISHVSEKSAGNAIQRSRAFQAADGGAAIAEIQTEQLMRQRAFADSRASEGIFSKESVQENWWSQDNYTGQQQAPVGSVLGVTASPRYTIEEYGQFVTDGGSGISSLDLGSAAYGSRSRSGRDVAIYRIQSQGYGSLNDVKSVVETIVGYSF
ncbi:MAG: PilX N-terminal domain-containing pilus assembly protein [Pseudomonadota bacterium]